MGNTDGLAVDFLGECPDDLVKWADVILQLDHWRRLNTFPRGVQNNLTGKVRRCSGWFRVWRNVLRAGSGIPRKKGCKNRCPQPRTGKNA